MITSGILLLVVGAVLRFAITAELAGIELGVVGVILMVGGAVLALVGIVAQARGRGETHVHERRSAGRGDRVTA